MGLAKFRERKKENHKSDEVEESEAKRVFERVHKRSGAYSGLSLISW